MIPDDLSQLVGRKPTWHVNRWGLDRFNLFPTVRSDDKDNVCAEVKINNHSNSDDVLSYKGFFPMFKHSLHIPGCVFREAGGGFSGTESHKLRESTTGNSSCSHR